MNVQRLKNLISLRTRNLSKRLQQALEELSESLSNGSQARPQPIPIPIRNGGRKLANSNYRRYFGTYCGFSGFNNSFKCNFQLNQKARCRHFNFLKFYHRHNTFKAPSKIFKALNRGFLFNNFSQVHQSVYRLKLFQNNVRISYRTLFNIPDFKQDKSQKCSNKFNPFVRLNISLSPEYHSITLKMARMDSTATYEEKIQCGELIQGCYIEFPVNVKFGIPEETILSKEVLDELLDDLTILQKRIEELKNDLMSLFDLGELPMKFISSRNVIRVYFPNCDRIKLENLCKEKNIKGGVIFEDDEMSEEFVPASPASTAVTHDDILSSYYNSNCSVSSFDSSDDDILSDSIQPLADTEIVRIEDSPAGFFNGEVSINNYEESYWVSSY